MRDYGTTDFVEVSPEMTLVLAPTRDAPLPPSPIALIFADGDTPTLSFDLAPAADVARAGDLVLFVQDAAFIRVGGAMPDDQRAFHLPSELRAIVEAITSCALDGETRKVYRLGKSIELLCEAIRFQGAGALVPFAGDGVLSLVDARRVVAARRMIDERWGEKLTLEKISRACGLNRAKLTRGFRDMFNSTIAEAISEKRLSQARLMLRTTDLPVSSIGYENGYLNNASFARAFSRRFGVSPSDFRSCPAAA